MLRSSGLAAPGAAARRVGALVLRYLYLLKGSWPRLLELAYWPSMQIILWGFISEHFLGHSSKMVEATGALLAAVLLWDVLFRGQLGYSISFLEELWSRNLGQLFISPLRPYELVMALISVSVIRTVIGIVPAALLAIPLYGYSIFELGPALVAFFVNLMMTGWALGLLVTSMLLRVGLGAEGVVWMAMFLLAPISAIYYPVSVLPDWLQAVAWALPPAYVFEGMRAVLFDGLFHFDLFAGALALNLVYLVFGAGVFMASFRAARHRGLLHQAGE